VRNRVSVGLKLGLGLGLGLKTCKCMELCNAADIQSSRKLSTVLNVMLAAGNYLNSSSSPSHVAAGFKLSSLAAFSRIHSSSGHMTLLQWVAKVSRLTKT
jgi:hypothetical protein